MEASRRYRDADAAAVGQLIAGTSSRYNLQFASPGERSRRPGPFDHAWSPVPAHREAIPRAIRVPLVLVAENRGEIVGVLRGSSGRLASLFVRGDHHRRGIGRRLVARFEHDRIHHDATAIRVAATLIAVPFYAALGYRKSTGIRNGRSLEGTGLQNQPMKKALRRARGAREP